MDHDGDWREEETQLTAGSNDGTPGTDEQVPGLTILAHADPSRVGERLPLPVLAVGREVRLSRLEPVFKPPGRPGARPLEDRSVSRRPIRLTAGGEPGAVALDRGAARTLVAAAGEPVAERRVFSAAEVERGVVLLVGRRVVLLLHCMPVRPPEPEAGFGLVGESAGIVRVRREIRRLAALDVPVLLRGATGTGKELVARALHDAGPRQKGPFVAVNMAAVPPSLAAAELFGASRGAFTGADRRKAGFFQHADGGTLFLDELGETPPEVQPMLLRALESHEILPVGSVEPVQVDVRVVTATDSRLEDAISAGHFRAPLLHRVAGYTVRLPSLAERRDDVGRLFFHFLKEELAAIGAAAALAGGEERPWPPAEAVARLGRHDWPGNVRELRNVARWMAIAGRGLAPGEIAAQLEDLLGEAAGRVRSTVRTRASSPRELRTAVARRRRLRKPADVGENELLKTLRAHRWQPHAAAEALGVSRANLYRLIEGCPAVRKASDLERDAIEQALACRGGDLESAAATLEVSLRGLKRRMTALGLPHG